MRIITMSSVLVHILSRSSVYNQILICKGLLAHSSSFPTIPKQLAQTPRHIKKYGKSTMSSSRMTKLAIREIYSNGTIWMAKYIHSNGTNWQELIAFLYLWCGWTKCNAKAAGHTQTQCWCAYRKRNATVVAQFDAFRHLKPRGPTKGHDESTMSSKPSLHAARSSGSWGPRPSRLPWHCLQ